MHIILTGLIFVVRGEVSVSNRGKKQPFREAFARVKDLRSFF